MSNKRQQYKPASKAKVALEAIKGEKTISELAAQYQVHPTMINAWKKALLQGAAGVFEKGKKQAVKGGPSEEELFREIGKLKMERDFLAKGLNR